jgi:ADP-ribose pyrophosphatase YjhB (NUDIX family)
MNADLQQALYLIADEMRGMATLADHFAESIYVKERAHKMMKLAAKIATLADGELSADDVERIFDKRPWLRVSPAIGVDAAVFNAKGEILLIQRADNQTWAMPGGIAEIGRTLAETCLHELWEEAGLKGRVVRPLGIFDGRHWGSRSPVHLINMVFQVECTDLNPVPGSEALDARFFAHNALPEPMNHNHVGRVPIVFEMMTQGCYLDLSDSTKIELDNLQRPD